MVLNDSYVCLHAFLLRRESLDLDPERQAHHYWGSSVTIRIKWCFQRRSKNSIKLHDDGRTVLGVRWVSLCCCCASYRNQAQASFLDRDYCSQGTNYPESGAGHDDYIVQQVKTHAFFRIWSGYLLCLWSRESDMLSKHGIHTGPTIKGRESDDLASRKWKAGPLFYYPEIPLGRSCLLLCVTFTTVAFGQHDSEIARHDKQVAPPSGAEWQVLLNRVSAFQRNDSTRN
jgi:hypothetical protein